MSCCGSRSKSCTACAGRGGKAGDALPFYEEYSRIHVEKEPFDCQMELAL